MVNILICVTGSVATIKLPMLAKELLSLQSAGVDLRVIATEHSKHFFKTADLPGNVSVLSDQDEWDSWTDRGDPVLHIELGKWADVLLIAPLDANTLAKIATGICDNLLTSTVRAWDLGKRLIFCPAMNTKMYDHPITSAQIKTLMNWGYHHIPVVQKTLVCGDTGLGAMAEVSTIVSFVDQLVNEHIVKKIKLS